MTQIYKIYTKLYNTDTKVIFSVFYYILGWQYTNSLNVKFRKFYRNEHSKTLL